MTRLLRIEFVAALCHTTTGENAQRDNFADENDCIAYLNLLANDDNLLGWLSNPFLLIDGHYHLLVETSTSNL